MVFTMPVSAASSFVFPFPVTIGVFSLSIVNALIPFSESLFFLRDECNGVDLFSYAN